MTEAATNQMIDAEREQRATARAHRVTATAWLAGITAVVALGTMSSSATIGTGIAVVGIAGMVTAVCYFILKD
jgi:hypothetical protein